MSRAPMKSLRSGCAVYAFAVAERLFAMPMHVRETGRLDGVRGHAAANEAS